MRHLTASIYGGTAGFYDMGPAFYGIYQSFLKQWRTHFVLEENLLEVDSSILLPYNVLKASGHVDRFCDIIIVDEVTGESFRADHYIEDALQIHEKTEEIENIIKTVDCMACQEIDAVISKFGIKTPSGNSFLPASKFNLMFETVVGYKDGGQIVYLRPETAQGQFLNFKKLYEYNNKKIPFGSASIGKVFRNEISPRGGLLRVREFEQAEIEFFVEPDNKKFEKFMDVKSLILPLKFNDIEILMELGEAVEKGIINNEVLGYFIGRTYQFLLSIGICKEMLRFRQHKKDEMAHYAKDCWDAEIFTSNGWIECVGIADRSAYDLTCHSKATNTELVYKKKLDEPIDVEEWVLDIDKSKWGKVFKNKFQLLVQTLSEIKSDEIESKKVKLENEYYYPTKFEDKEINIKCNLEKRKIYEISIIPDVIEPSFGIGRILYSLLEHSFYLRSDDRPVLRLPPKISGIKCVITSLVNNNTHKEKISKLRREFIENDIFVEVNERSCSIGKRYATCDEIGIPFFITFDPQTTNDNKVTVRERDSMDQIRVDVDNVVTVVDKLIKGSVSWEILLLDNAVDIENK